MCGRNKQISVYAKELLDTSFLVTFFYYVINNHFYHSGRLDRGTYDNIIMMTVAVSLLSLLIRWVVVTIWGFKRLPLRQYVGYLQLVTATGVILYMYQIGLFGQDAYWFLSEAAFCLMAFSFTTAKIRNA